MLTNYGRGDLIRGTLPVAAGAAGAALAQTGRDLAGQYARDLGNRATAFAGQQAYNAARYVSKRVRDSVGDMWDGSKTPRRGVRPSVERAAASSDPYSSTFHDGSVFGRPGRRHIDYRRRVMRSIPRPRRRVYRRYSGGKMRSYSNSPKYRGNTVPIYARFRPSRRRR